MTKTLKQQIAAVLANANAGSEELSELIAATEAAATAEQTAVDERKAAALDLTQCPDPKQAHDRIVESEISRDQLKAALPKLRERLAAALAAENKERWLADFQRVAEQRDQAAAAFRRYPELANEIAEIFALAEQVDREVSRINGSAPDGTHHRLRGVELTARDLQQFTRDNPSLAKTVELRCWDGSERRIWPLQSSGSFAAGFASGMVVPHPGANWSSADVQAQRRAEAEKEQARIADFYAEQTKTQEERQNREQREARRR